MTTARTATERFRALRGKAVAALAGAAVVAALSITPASAESVYHEPGIGPAYTYPYPYYPYPYPAYAYPAYPSYPYPYPYYAYPYYGYYGPGFAFGPGFGVYIRRR